MTRLALYARVSKAGDQTPENQLMQLRAWASSAQVNGLPITVAGEYVDEISSRDTRPRKEEVLRLLRLGQIDGVVFVALDRWGRGMTELVLEFDEAVARKWILISLREGINLDSAAGMLYARMLAAFANFERERIRERTLSGVARARSQGKRIGRPSRVFDASKALELRQAGKSWREIAVSLKVPQATIRKRLKGVQQVGTEKQGVPPSTEALAQEPPVLDKAEE